MEPDQTLPPALSDIAGGAAATKAYDDSAAAARAAFAVPVEPMLQFFAYAHLPPHLQEVSKPFGDLALGLLKLPRNPERTVALRKLLEAKDCAVRATIFKAAQ